MSGLVLLQHLPTINGLFCSEQLGKACASNVITVEAKIVTHVSSSSFWLSIHLAFCQPCNQQANNVMRRCALTDCYQAATQVDDLHIAIACLGRRCQSCQLPKA